jgi:hypothetical protein
MKQFLRFQISGLTCLLWVLLFLLPYIDFSKLLGVEGMKAAVALLGSVALGLPLGTIIHQISISILSPFRKFRFFNKRKILDDLRQRAELLKIINRDTKNQALLVLQQATRLSWEEGDLKKELNIDYVGEEISNRYSYYYVRIDNGVIAPLFALIASKLLYNYLSFLKAPILLAKPIFCPYVMPFIALVICVLMTMYIPELLREVDDLERLILTYEQRIHHHSNEETSIGRSPNTE